MAETTTRVSLGEQSATQLANVTKTAPIYGAITPRWLVRLLDWKPLEAGIFRRNRVVEEKTIEVLCSHADESIIAGTYAEYEEAPREYRLSSINSVLNVDTRVGDLFSNPYDQVREQLRVTIESVKERQENELLNNADYGLLNNVADSQRVSTRKGAPTPDDLDELIDQGMERAIVLSRQSTRHRRFWPRMHASWRAPSDRDAVRQSLPYMAWNSADSHRQDSCCRQDAQDEYSVLRVGERKQGVIGLFQPGLTGEQSPGLSVRFMGVSDRGLRPI